MPDNEEITKLIFQTSFEAIPEHVSIRIKALSPGWSYQFYNDEDILQFFKNNPLKEFPHIEKVFNSFSNGAHRADLFRYYFLYILGGVFIDSDAIIEDYIEDIIEDNSFVSINSYHADQQLIFNGFIACSSKHPIIYAALKNAYQIKNEDLVKDYHLICKNLYIIIRKNPAKKVKIYQEIKTKKFRAGVITYKEGRKLLTHYCYLKCIPKFSLPESFYPYIFSNKQLYQLYKFFKR